MSTASCALWFSSNPEYNTSIARSSVAGTLHVHVPQLGVQPHSGASLAAHARESESALERRRPERGRAARCCLR